MSNNKNIRKVRLYNTLKYLLLFVFLTMLFAEDIIAKPTVTLSKRYAVKGVNDVIKVTWSGFSGNVNVAVYRGNKHWVYAATDVSGSGSQQLVINSAWEVRSDCKVRVELRSKPGIYAESDNFSVNNPPPSSKSDTKIIANLPQAKTGTPALIVQPLLDDPISTNLYGTLNNSLKLIHAGEDLHSNKWDINKTPVYAIMEGTVEDIYRTNDTSKYCDGTVMAEKISIENHGYGNVVVIKHNDHLYSLYAHHDCLNKEIKKGASIKQGQQIGIMGNSAYEKRRCGHGDICKPSTDPQKQKMGAGQHLHIEVRTFPSLNTKNWEYAYTKDHPDKSGYIDPKKYFTIGNSKNQKSTSEKHDVPVVEEQPIFAPLEHSSEETKNIPGEADNYFRQRDYEKASVLYEDILKKSPTPDVYYYLAVCYHEIKKDDKSLAYLQEGVAKFPGNYTLWKSLGMIYYQKGERDKAVKAFEEVIRFNPEDSQANFMLKKLRRE